MLTLCYNQNEYGQQIPVILACQMFSGFLGCETTFIVKDGQINFDNPVLSSQPETTIRDVVEILQKYFLQRLDMIFQHFISYLCNDLLEHGDYPKHYLS